MVSELKDRILNVYNKRLEAFLSLCESEIEKLFLLHFIHYWESRFSFNYHGLIFEFDAPLEEGEYRPWISNGRQEYNIPYCIKILDYGEDIILIPQYIDKLEEKVYRLDFRVELRSKNKPTIKVCIECDGYDYHYKDVKKVNSDNERVLQLTKHGYYVIRLTGSQINSIRTDEDFGKIMDSILLMRLDPDKREEYLKFNREGCFNS